MTLTQKYDFDKSRTHLLLSELEQAQQNQVYQITPADQRKIWLDKKARNSLRHGEWWFIAAVVGFVDDDRVLGSLLRLSKASSSEALKRCIYK